MRGMVARGEKYDACITDPPFHLTSITKRFGKQGSAPAQYGKDGAAGRISAGFMQKTWDGIEDGELPIAFDPETWKLVLALLKPGGRLLSFGGTRTFHRMACAIEDAGFIYEDTIVWAFGTGLVLSKTRLKPGWSPVVMARAPGRVIDLNINDCRVDRGSRPYRIAADNETLNNAYSGFVDRSLTQGAKAVGETTLGGWPADIVHDNSADVVSLFPDAPGQLAPKRNDGVKKTGSVYGDLKNTTADDSTVNPRGDQGSAARYFNSCEWEEGELQLVYNGKCKASDRKGSKHSTVKSISLLKHFIQLITKSGDRLLEPFAGSGTLGEAAVGLGRNVTMIEREDEYVSDILLRMAAVEAAG